MTIPEFANDKGSKKHSRFICSADGGNILTLYVRIFSFHNSRLFQAINMFQCDKCLQFFAMEDGTHSLTPLIVKRKDISSSSKNERRGGE